MEIKLQQQLMGTTGMDLTVSKTSEPDMKKKTKGEERVSIYMKENQV